MLPLAWAAPWRQCIVLERSAEAAVATLLRLWGQGDEIVARQRRCARLHERFFSFPPGTSFAFASFLAAPCAVSHGLFLLRHAGNGEMRES